MVRFAPLAPIPFLALLLAALPAQGEEKTYMIESFDRVRVEGPFVVRVAAGGSARARAVGDRRAVEQVAVRMSGRTLVISASVNGWGGFPGSPRALPVIEVATPALRGASVIGGGTLTVDRMVAQRVDISLSGAGSLSVGAVQADRLDAIIVGSGALTVGGRVLDARFQANGAGSVDASALSVADLVVNAQGSGDTRFAARDTAQVFAAGQGSVTVLGDPACTVRGTAPVACGRLRPAQ